MSPIAGFPVEVDRRPVEDEVAHRHEEPAGVQLARDRTAVQRDLRKRGQVQVVRVVLLDRVRDKGLGRAGFQRTGRVLLRRRVGCGGDVGDDQPDRVVGVGFAAQLAEQVDQPAGDLRLGVQRVGAQAVEEAQGGFGVAGAEVLREALIIDATRPKMG